jgi:hypothetical protein
LSQFWITEPGKSLECGKQPVDNDVSQQQLASVSLVHSELAVTVKMSQNLNKLTHTETCTLLGSPTGLDTKCPRNTRAW